LLKKTDPLYNNVALKTNSWLHDAGLSILTTSGVGYFELAKEIGSRRTL
jgi:hypothetical protein